MDIAEECESLFLSNTNTVNAEAMQRYMRGKFRFAGLKAGERRMLQKTVFPPKDAITADYLMKTIPYFWKSPLREMQYSGIELVSHSADILESDFIETAEFMITHKS